MYSFFSELVPLLTGDSREYKKVPYIKEDNVIPSMSEIPSLLNSIRHPRKNRSVSIGPQSAADAYETLAFREKRRRESVTSIPEVTAATERNQSQHNESYFDPKTSRSASSRFFASSMPPTPALSNLDLSQHMAGVELAVYTPPTPDPGLAVPGTLNRRPSDDRRQYDREDREMFSRLEKPRVRYDVEVITKLIVYSGMVKAVFTLHVDHY